MDRWPALTGMRGIAALGVVVFHVMVTTEHVTCRLPWAPGLRLGWVGVDFFFVLSAFLLTAHLLRDRARDPRRASWPVFMAQRLLRIAPPYYISVVLALAVGTFAAACFTPAGRPPLGLVLGMHAAYLQNVHYPTMLAVNPIYWTLAVEFQFYLLLPWLAARLSTPRRNLVVGVLIAGALAWRGVTYWLATRFEDTAAAEPLASLGFFTLPAFLAHFGVGAWAAWHFVEGPPRLRVPPLAVVAGGAALVVAALLIGVPGTGPAGPFSQAFDSWTSNLLVRPLVAVGFAAIIRGSVRPGTLGSRFFSWAPIEALGLVSYSLYLVHGPVLGILGRVGGLAMAPFPLFLAAGTAGSLLVATLFYLVVEEPSMALRHRVMARWLERRTTRAAPA